jgi:hypothetical protein
VILRYSHLIGAAALAMGLAACRADPPDEAPTSGPTLSTAPMVLASVTEATAIPAHWFLSIQPGAEVSKEVLDACARGDLTGLPLTLAVIEVSSTRVAIAGEVVMEGEGWHLQPPKSGADLRAALQALGETNKAAARAGCRPWAVTEPRPPADFRPEPSLAPPVLAVVDAAAPAHWFDTVQTQARFADLRVSAVWVADEEPEPPALQAEVATSGGILRVQHDGQALQWAVEGPDEVAEQGYTPSSFRVRERWATVEVDAFPSAVAAELDAADIVVVQQRAREDVSFQQIVSVQDRLSQRGVRCVNVVAGGVGVVPPAGNPPGGDPSAAHAALQLRASDTLAVLPVTQLGGSGPSVARDEPSWRLLTGELCPRLARVAQPPSGEPKVVADEPAPESR